MNTEDDYFDGDMSDDEYRERIQRERERDEFYARVAKAAEMHSDSGYRESTQEKQAEFARKRNQTDPWNNWKANKDIV